MHEPARSVWPWLTILGALVMVGLFSVDTAERAALWLDVRYPEEVWRYLIGHWIHVDQEHLAWNVAAYMVIGSWVECQSRARLVIGLCLGMFSVSVWFMFSAPTQWYCGLSGVMNTLMVMALVGSAQTALGRNDRAAFCLILATALGFFLKVAVELVTTYQWVTVGSWVAAPGAHAAGLAAGLAWAAAYRYQMSFVQDEPLGERCAS